MSEHINPVKLNEYNRSFIFSKKNTNNQPKIDNINLPNVDNEYVDITQEIESNNLKSYSSSNLSDYNTIKINYIGTLTSQLINYFDNKDEYELACLYFEGKTLGEITDENGNLVINIPQLFSLVKKYNPNMTIPDIINTIRRIIIATNKVNLIDFTSELENIKIVDIIYTQSGFDAVVLQKADGTYFITASCTNGSSYSDMSTEGYILGEYVFDGVIGGLISDSIFEGNSDEFLNNSSPSKALYYTQVHDAEFLISKYITKASEEGNKCELFGYSLGGGIISTAYAKNKIKNPKLTECISSVTVYNPFLLTINSYIEPKLTKVIDHKVIFEEYINSEKIIATLKDDEKFRIFSAEGDLVSTLNPFLESLNERITYIKCKKIEKNNYTIPNLLSKESFSSFEINTTEYINFIKAIFNDYVIGDSGNHGLDVIDNAFNSNGYLKTVGEYQNVNEIIANITGNTYDGNQQYPHLSYIAKILIKDHFALFEYTKFERYPDFWQIIEYICDNAGNFDKKEFLDVLANMMSDYMTSDYIIDNWKEIFNPQNDKDKDIFFKIIIEDNQLHVAFIKELKNFLEDDHNYQKFLKSLKLFLVENDSTTFIQTIQNIFILNLKNISDSTIDEIASTISDIIWNSDLIIKHKNFISTFIAYSIDSLVNEVARLLKDDNFSYYIEALQENNYEDLVEPFFDEFSYEFNEVHEFWDYPILYLVYIVYKLTK